MRNNEPTKIITHWLIFSKEEYEFCQWYYAFLQGLSERDTEVASPGAQMRDLSQESP